MDPRMDCSASDRFGRLVTTRLASLARALLEAAMATRIDQLARSL